MFLLDRASTFKPSIYVPALKGISALHCLSNPVGIPDKFRAELRFWIEFEWVHRDIHPVITVPVKLGDSGRTTQEVLERITHRSVYITM